MSVPRWVWALGVVALLLAAWLVIRFVFRDRTGSNRIMADVIDTWAKPAIEQKRVELEKLQKEQASNTVEIQRAENELQKVRVELKKKYIALNLTPQEMTERLGALRV